MTPAQVDRWARDFDNRGVCDTLCFARFDRNPNAWNCVGPWSRRKEEFVKRAAADDRNFVKKGASRALRVIGRRHAALNPAAVAVARRLKASDHPGARRVGRDAFRELTSAAVVRRLTRGAAT